MPRHSLIGTELDAIFQSARRRPAWRVVLFDPYQDTFSDMVLGTHSQIPLDITRYVKRISITDSFDHDSSQLSIDVAPSRLSYKLFMWSWVRVYYGDSSVDVDNWPCVFTGIFQGQPARTEERGNLYAYSHTAYGRSLYYRQRTITSTRAWNPQDTDANVGEIAAALATDSDYGMGLQRQEVLFGKFYRQPGVTTGTGSGAIVPGEEWRINKKLQIVDINIFEALTNILQVVRHSPAFNSEGKLVARSLAFERPITRLFAENKVVKSVEIPQNTYQLTTSVVVRGLDYRMTRVDAPVQRILTIGPFTIGFWSPSFLINKAYDEEEKQAVEPEPKVRNIKFEGSLLSQIFAYAPGYTIVVRKDGEFRCVADVDIDGLWVAYGIVLLTVAAYIVAKATSSSLGQVWAPLGWVLETVATALIFLVFESLRALGSLSFEIWGVPYEYCYREIEAKATLSDVLLQEEQEEEIENHILGTLHDCKDLAAFELRRRAAMIATRTIRIAPDLLLEPGDIISVLEEGVAVEYFITEIAFDIERGGSPLMTLSVFRIR